MKKATVIFCALGFIISCSLNQKQESKDNNEYESFTKVFQAVEQILDKDQGQFWNHSLKGPILLVNPKTREIISNQNNLEKNFRKLNGVFIDTLPKEINIANTALDWDGKRWSMIMLPLPKEEKDRNNLIIHELYHRIQPEIGFDELYEKSNAHLDTYNGRLHLKLELNALLQAIQSKGKDRTAHLENAFRFRKERHTSNDIRDAENTLELNEGLAEYTAVSLSGRSTEELEEHFKRSVENFFDNKTFVRSFAYQTIPMYGCLLSQIKETWHREIKKETKLTDFFESSFSLQIGSSNPIEVAAKANHYDFNKINEEEQTREEEHLRIVAGYKDLFLNRPSLKLEFENMKISFDPRNIMPLEDIGTVYPTLRVSDNWGILTVDNGALVSADWKHVIVSEPKHISGDTIIGEGWKLEINENWGIEKTNTMYQLKKK